MATVTPDPQDFDERCENCGLTFGAHRGDATAHNQCPQHEGYMDWSYRVITVFEPSGVIEDVATGTPASKDWRV